MGKLWKKNDTDQNEDLARKVEAFTVGRDYLLDLRLIPYDIRASKIHAEGLERIDVLTSDECSRLMEVLDELQSQWLKGNFEIKPEEEDGHTAIENYLTEKLGEVGEKIHAGRSRNDQVLTALRLYERDQLEQIFRKAKQLAGDFLDFADQYVDVPMPGYTHTQRAMLSSVGLWAASYAERVMMTLEYLPGLYRNVNRCPLGTAAGYGVNFNLQRDFVAERLGFEKPIITSMTAQHTRGQLEVELLSGLLPLSVTLSRFSNDLILYTTREFDFFEVAAELCTGSSIMPQKKNFDTAEIMRGRQGEIEGMLAQLKGVTRNLASGYHRDLQLTKEPILNGLEKLKKMLEMGCLIIQNISPKQENLRKACTPEIFAADMANEKVKEGRSFREAYREVANNLDQLEEMDIDKNLQTKKHLGAPGNPGLSLLRGQLENLSLK